MKELIARLEAATEGSRELDVVIYKKIRPYPAMKLKAADQWAADMHHAPHYTTSIDAALTLYKKKPEFIAIKPLAACIEALKQW